jgi:hypothetical protein
LKNVIEKRCSLGLFSFALFIAFDPVSAQIEAVTETADSSSKNNPARSRSASRNPWKTSIVTTVFWIGERPSRNNRVPNRTSSWDKQWARNYGGFDDPNPANRSNYRPQSSRRDRTHFTARSLTTTSDALVIGPKRRRLFHGLKRRLIGESGGEKLREAAQEKADRK